MKKQLMMAVALGSAAVLAEPSGDRPDATHAWAVHDVNRPDPVKIEVPQGGIPSDAIVLFDGTQASVDRNWRSKDGTPSKWTVKDGEFICTPGSGGAFTKEEFGDCQVHVEWKTPMDDLEGWGNSGVFLMGCYEIQILDSSNITPSRSPFKPANYADGQAGAIYGQSPCLVNPCRKTGEWQSYDIVFHPPYRNDKGEVIDTGDMTVFFNGVLVQDHWQLEGSTHWCRRYLAHAEKGVGPLRLQDHGHPVPFRNIWIRKIPSRHANTTHGGPYVDKGDVKALRQRLAVESKQFAAEAKDPFEKYIRLWESYCYEKDESLKPQIEAATAAVLAAVKAGDERVTALRRAFVVERFVKMLANQGFIPHGTELEIEIGKVCRGYEKPKAGNLRDI